MQVYGVDLSAWWQARRWSDLLDLVDQLPAASRTREAILNDDELAEQILDHELTKPEQPFRPEVRSYDLTNLLLLRLSNQVAALSGAGPEDQLESPRTAVDDARDRRRHTEAVSIIAAATPQYAHLFSA